MNVRVGERTFEVRPHAIARYQERVRPALDEVGVRAELDRVLRGAVVVYDRPAWCSPASSNGNYADSWVMLGDSIVFPACGRALLTCMTRGEVGSEIRVRRQEQRREYQDRQARPGAKKKHGKVARDERRRAQATREAQPW